MIGIHPALLPFYILPITTHVLFYFGVTIRFNFLPLIFLFATRLSIQVLFRSAQLLHLPGAGPCTK